MRFSPARPGYRPVVGSNDVAHKIALALTEASQIGGSSQVSGSSNNKSKDTQKSPKSDRNYLGYPTEAQ